MSWGASCPGGRVALGASCPGTSCPGASCPGASYPRGELSGGRIVLEPVIYSIYERRINRLHILPVMKAIASFESMGL